MPANAVLFMKGALAPVDGDVLRVYFLRHISAERLPFKLANEQETRAVLFLKAPRIAAGPGDFRVAENAQFAAPAVHPILVLEREIVGGGLTLVDLSKVIPGKT